MGIVEELVEIWLNEVCDTAILYQANQPADPMSWDGNFSLISLFGTVKVLEGDAKNIVCSLQRITTFIKQRPLSDKDGLDIP